MIQIISYLVYIDFPFPQDLQTFLIGTVFFQNNIFPNIGAQTIDGDNQNPPYHEWFGNIIIDQQPNDIIKNRTGLSTLYFMNGLGHVYMNIFTLSIFLVLKLIKHRKIETLGLKEKILYFGNIGSCVPHFFALCLQFGNFSSINRINRISYMLSVIAGVYQILLLWILYDILIDLWHSYHVEQ